MYLEYKQGTTHLALHGLILEPQWFDEPGWYIILKSDVFTLFFYFTVSHFGYKKYGNSQFISCLYSSSVHCVTSYTNIIAPGVI